MKKLRLTSVAAAAALAAASLVAYAPASNAAAKTITIGFQGPLTGEEAQVGQDELAGVLYAVKLFNAKNKGKYVVKVVQADDQGDPAQAAKVAPGIASNDKIIGLVGAAYSGATIASLPFYKQRLLPMISPSATRVSITDPASPGGALGLPVFHRVVVTDRVQGPSLFKLATKGVASPKVFVVDDQSAYGVGLVDYMKPSIPAGQSAGFDSVSDKTTDWSATISKIKTAGANVVIYTGYFPQAAPFFKQLRDSGYTGILAGGDGVLSPSFVKLAPASVLEGVRLTAGTVPLAEIDAKLEADFVKKMGKPSGVYAAESIDAVNVFLAGIAKGVSTRDAMLKFVKSYSGKSLTGTTIKFDAYGDVAGGALNGFVVKGGVIKFDGPVK
ncbi:MAG: branched-chain amino acid ABC transporter substrate-binding protein [Actinomycetota bacterium]